MHAVRKVRMKVREGRSQRRARGDEGSLSMSGSRFRLRRWHGARCEKINTSCTDATEWSEPTVSVRDVALEIAFKKSAGALGDDFLGHIRNRL